MVDSWIRWVGSQKVYSPKVHGLFSSPNLRLKSVRELQPQVSVRLASSLMRGLPRLSCVTCGYGWKNQHMTCDVDGSGNVVWETCHCDACGTASCGCYVTVGV